MKKIKLKISSNQIMRSAYFLSIFLAIATIFWLAWFLYNNSYLTIFPSEDISSLEEIIKKENLNLKKFEKIIKNIDSKNKLREINQINNPFD